jgi:hypothetical protein
MQNNTKSNLPLLEENLELLLQHADEIKRIPAYYHSRIISNVDSESYDQLGSILLGPYLEFWKHVPVNNAGKLLLTYELVGNFKRNLECLRSFYPDNTRRFPQDDLEEESGFLYKKPLPGISRYQLKDIMYRYMKQFLKPDLPLGAPLELVVQELIEGKPLHERTSQKYATVRDKLVNAVAEATATDGLYYVPDTTIDAYSKLSREWVPKQPPVTFNLEQEKDLRLKIAILVEVPVKKIEVHGVTGMRVSTVGLNDLMLACLTEFHQLLEPQGFVKAKATTSVSGGGLEAIYTCSVNSMEDVLTPEYLSDFGNLMQGMYQIIRQQGLQACAGLS